MVPAPTVASTASIALFQRSKVIVLSVLSVMQVVCTLEWMDE